MYATGNKKMLNMLILELLKEYSDAEHRLTQQEIIKLLKLNYGMECDRRSVKNNILSLKEMGYEISMEDGYYLMEREFEDSELRMLIDSVLFSKSISTKQAKTIIGKLRKQANKYFNAKVTHVSNLPELHHIDNKQVMYTLDVLNDAISEKKQIQFTYNAYDTDFKLHPKRDISILQQLFKTDILIYFKKSGKTVIVEDKVYSSEHDAQIAQYRKRICELSAEENAIWGSKMYGGAVFQPFISRLDFSMIMTSWLWLTVWSMDQSFWISLSLTRI